MRTISAADANRYFSKLLREVSDGETVVVTSRGRPVARMVPMSEDERRQAEQEEAARQARWEEHLARLRAQPALGIPITWTRDDVYDDDF